jgi:hypothetical protein
MTQLNTPYPATAYLMGCLRKHAADTVEVAQADLSIALFLRLFSRDGLTAVQAELKTARGRRRKNRFDGFLSRAETYAALVEPTVRFLQGRDPSLAMRIAGRAFLPEGPRFASLDADEELLGWAFGELGVTVAPAALAGLFPSTISPTSSVTASIPASSCRATAEARVGAALRSARRRAGRAGAGRPPARRSRAACCAGPPTSSAQCHSPAASTARSDRAS